MNRIYVSNPEIKHSHSKAIITLHSYNRERITLINKVKYLRRELLKKIKLLIFQNKELLGDAAKKTIKAFLHKELKILRKYKLRLNFNGYKFEEKLLHKLTNIIEYNYNKKVEFNIVNMKSVIFSSDIFTKVLGEKL
jgi:putative IMPACT (imprinted ancient) family translation regulator